jgi:hypothetical protein
MNEDQIRQVIDQIDPESKIPSSVVEDLVISLGKEEKLEAEKLYVIEKELKNELTEETDWRKKAVLAAKIISLNLD